MKVNYGCGEFYADGWTNLDHVHEGKIRPDIVMVPGEPMPFEDGSVEALYAGHVMEHVPWDDVPRVLADFKRVLAPGGQVCIVGPDVYKTLVLWRAGQLDDWLMIAVLENASRVEGTHDQFEEEPWPGARHSWNCSAPRVIYALERAGFEYISEVPVTDEALEGWPLVAATPWQCGVTGVKL
jgi:SAM-dependent methyltransferase